jgi:hypothetical protein
MLHSEPSQTVENVAVRRKERPPQISLSSLVHSAAIGRAEGSAISAISAILAGFWGRKWDVPEWCIEGDPEDPCERRRSTFDD